MPLPSLKVWLADEDFLASDINGNFTTIVNKFTDAAGAGISDGDVASDAGISGLKLSNASGKQIITDRIAPDAVTNAILRDDSAVDANRAVTADHIRNEAVIKRAVKLGDLTKSQMAIGYEEKSFSLSSVVTSSNASVTVDRHTTGANFDAYVAGQASGVAQFARTLVTPTTAIPTATKTLIACYVSDLVITVGVGVTGKVVFVYISNS